MGVSWVSQNIGEIIKLRRNANNVPGELVAGDIAWVSQPINSIVNLRRCEGDYPGPSGWSIDGVSWNGRTSTVGAGKDYATLSDAIVAANTAGEDCLYLVYGGTYATPSTPPTHKAYIRGLGINTTDVVIVGSLNNHSALMFLENVWHYALNGYGLIPVKDLIINKCKLGTADLSPNGQMPLVGENLTGTIYASYTQFAGSYRTTYWWTMAHLTSADKSKVSIYKCSWNELYNFTGWVEYECTGTLAVDDKAVDETSGYGPANGSFRIVSGGASSSVSTISQPIGNIIRLRRNTSNVPEE